MQKNNLYLPGAIIIAGMLISGTIFFTNNSGGNNQTANVKDSAQNTPTEIKIRPVTKDDHILGSLDAEITVVEYSDPECPFCKDFHAVMQRVIKEYGDSGKVAWVYRNFPLDKPDARGRVLHSQAGKEAQALECAGSLGGNTKFWEYTDLLYKTTTSNNTLDLALLPVFATDVGLDVTKFNSCLTSGKFASKVEADYQDLLNSGAQNIGTPFNVIVDKDGTKTAVPGLIPYENMKAAIDAKLKK